MHGHTNTVRETNNTVRGYTNPGRDANNKVRGYPNPVHDAYITVRGYTNPGRDANNTLRGYTNPVRDANLTVRGYPNPVREANNILRGYTNPVWDANITEVLNSQLGHFPQVWAFPVTQFHKSNNGFNPVYGSQHLEQPSKYVLPPRMSEDIIYKADKLNLFKHKKPFKSLNDVEGIGETPKESNTLMLKNRLEDYPDYSPPVEDVETSVLLPLTEIGLELLPPKGRLKNELTRP
uniref:Uncharacterized protein n=1 Tax=Timema bartmani TaxID=61472 RepID=A0A7R9FAS4_9NEOP|nr:unnamed protein product [Timema bartmani]